MSVATLFNRLQSNFSGLVGSADTGDVHLSQTIQLTTTADGLAVNGTLTLPASAQLLSIIIDKIVNLAVGGGTATTLPVTVGTAAAGTQYVTAVDMFSTARAASTYTVAQLLAMSNIGTNTSLVVTVDPNGTVLTTQAVIQVTILYSQRV